MPIYEVFLKKDGRDEFRHAGALDAADDQLAIIAARECYVRRGEGDRVWVIDRDDIVTEDPAFFAPNHDKPHRHHSGEAVAARRKEIRQAAEAATAGEGADS